jgi:hypothetical protein
MNSFELLATNRMKKNLIILVLPLLFACSSKESGGESESQAVVESLGSDGEIADGQRVFFGNLNNGDELSSPIHVEMKVEGMEVEPAGELAKNKGHHHILVNHEPSEKGAVVVADSTHIHFGKGQIEAELNLPPGEYNLTLQFADGFHRSYGPKMSTTVTIVVTQ